jgi:hypothetical protein
MTPGEMIQGAVGLISTISVSSVAGAIVGNYIFGTFVSEKIKGQIKSEYDEKLANLKSQLDEKLANTKSQLDKEIEAHKAMLKSEYDGKLATHKALLKRQSDIEIEQLKSRLSIVASQRQIQFTNLQEKRATILAETHGYLVEIIGALYSFLVSRDALIDAAYKFHRTSESVDEKSRRFSESYSEFDRFFSRNRIFLPKSTADKIGSILGDLLLTSWQVEYAVKDAIQDPDKRDLLDSYSKIKKPIDEVTAELEEEFRVLLGDEPSPDKRTFALVKSALPP